jgi:hypothetical protein
VVEAAAEPGMAGGRRVGGGCEPRLLRYPLVNAAVGEAVASPFSFTVVNAPALRPPTPPTPMATLLLRGLTAAGVAVEEDAATVE